HRTDAGIKTNGVSLRLARHPSTAPKPKRERNPMKPITALVIAGLTMALTGCVVTSVYPFYTNENLIFETKLLGSWNSASAPKERWTFTRAGGTSYKVALMNNSTNSYEAHLFKLDGQMFLDLLPDERHDDFIPP